MVPQPKKAPGKAAGASEKPAKPVKATQGVTASATPGAPTTTSTGNDTSSSGPFSKPDQAAYNKAQAELRAKIDELTSQVNAAQSKVELAGNDGPNAERRAALKTELDDMKRQQSGLKGNRAKILDQLKALQESSQTRARALQAAKQKVQFKTVEEIENHVRGLERQIESGTFTLTGEKKALADISASKRARKAVEQFQVEQDAIDAERARAEGLRRELDDPESKAISERYEAIKTELDTLKAESDEIFANRNRLFEQKRALVAQLDEAWAQKKESMRLYREAGDRYFKKVQEERQKKAERYAAQRAAAEEERRKEVASRIREEAEVPAYQTQIEDCQTLIDFLALKAGGGSSSVSIPSALVTRSEITGIPKLETRTVENNADALVARKKKGEEEDNYFVGGKGKKKGGAKATNGAASPGPAPETKFNLPLPTLSALLSLSIPPPSSHGDVSRTIEDLKTKKAWFEANQARVTAENIARADAEIKHIDTTLKTSPSAVVSAVDGQANEEPTEALETLDPVTSTDDVVSETTEVTA